MYIGPWQEFKLAKIIQLKEKHDREVEDNNRIEDLPRNQRGAYSHQNGPLQPLNSQYDPFQMNAANQAYSMQNGGGGPVYHNQQNMYPHGPLSNGSGMHGGGGSHSVNTSMSLQRANIRQMANLQKSAGDNAYKYQVESRYRPQKNIPILMPNGKTVGHKQLVRDAIAGSERPPRHHKSQRHNEYYQVASADQGRQQPVSFVGANSNHSKSLRNHIQAHYQNSQSRSNLHMHQDANTAASLQGGFVRQQSDAGSTKMTYLSGTASTQAKENPSGHQTRKRSRKHGSQTGEMSVQTSQTDRVDSVQTQVLQAQKTSTNNGSKAMMKYEQNAGPLLDQQYEKWARFENFLKFAEKKEVRDRLKEFDPPPMSNYVDVNTIDNIHKSRRQAGKGGKPPKAPRDQEDNSEHLARIQKMKELYGMFLKMDEQNEQTNPQKSEPRLNRSPTGKFAEVPPHQHGSKETAPFNVKLPAVEISPRRFITQMTEKNENQISEQTQYAPEQPMQPYYNNNKSSFTGTLNKQKAQGLKLPEISPGGSSAGVAKLQQTYDKYSNSMHARSKPAVRQSHDDPEDLEVEERDDVFVESLGQGSPTKNNMGSPSRTNNNKLGGMRHSRLENSMGKNSNFTLGGGPNEGQADDLIDWANALSDDISSSAGQSFYGKMIPQTNKL